VVDVTLLLKCAESEGSVGLLNHHSTVSMYSQVRKVIGQRQGCRVVVKGYGKAQDPYG